MGSLLLFIVAYFTYHCMMLLVHTRRKLESNLKKLSEISSFGDLGFVVCGPVGRFAVDAMIILSQAGFCVSYIIFLSNTLANIFNYEIINPSPEIFGISAKVVYMWGCFSFQLGLNALPTLTHLAPLSIFADVIDIGAMGVVMVEDVMIYMKKMPTLISFGDLNVLFYGLGVAVYAFEGVGMVLPVESEMKERKKFGKVLGFSMASIAIMFGAFGTLGYFAFGEGTRDIMTTNLGWGWLSGVVQICLCVNLFISFPLMMNPVYEVVERRYFEGRYCLWVRFGMVLAVPNFADFLSFVGSSVCIVLGFVLPALFHLIVYKEELGWLGLGLDGSIIVFGFTFAITGTWTSLMEFFAVKA